MTRFFNSKDFKNSFGPHFALLLSAVFLFVGKPVPYSNEYNYLLRLKHLYNPGYLTNDITFSTPANEYWLFDHVFGLFTLFLSIEVVGWIGRITCWSLLLVALMKLGKRWEIPRWMISVSIFLWLAVGQSIIAEEWMIGVFEAKCVAYICLLFSLDRLCDGREFSSAVLLGFSFAIHPVVGFWGILAVIPALLITHRDLVRTLKVASVAAVIALIGAIPLLQMRTVSIEPTLENLKVFELVKFPFHFDPFSWSRSAIVLVCVMLVFCVFVHFKDKLAKPNTFLISFLGILGLYFILGVLARVFELFELMKYTPTRLFAVFIPLFFFFHLSKSWKEGLLKHPVSLFLLIAIFAGTLWLSLPVKPITMAKSTVESWNQPADDMAHAFEWIGENTPKETVVIAPPWRYDFWYLSERGQLVNNNKPIISDVNEWIRRLDKLTGKSDPAKGIREDEELREVYNALTRDNVEAIASEFKVNYFISESDYPFKVVYSKGTAKIYKLLVSN